MPEWNGIERRLERLKGCSLKLEPLKTKTSDEFASDPYRKDYSRTQPRGRGAGVHRYCQSDHLYEE
jgi:hypothetical protein